MMQNHHLRRKDPILMATQARSLSLQRGYRLMQSNASDGKDVQPASRSQSRLFRILDAKGSSEAYADITQGQATRKNDEKEACFLWTPTMPKSD